VRRRKEEIGTRLCTYTWKWHELTLEEKISVIKDNESGNGVSKRILAEKNAIPETRVTKILSSNTEYQNDYSARVEVDHRLFWLKSIQTKLYHWLFNKVKKSKELSIKYERSYPQYTLPAK